MSYDRIRHQCPALCGRYARAGEARSRFAHHRVVAQRQLELLLARFPLVCPRGRVLQLAREMHVTHRMAFWDAMIHAACVDAGIQKLYSEDLPGHAGVGLEVVNPFAGL